MTGKKLYEAYHLYLMIAIMPEKFKLLPPQDFDSSKDDLSSQKGRKSSTFRR
jgi:hypothetical protein